MVQSLYRQMNRFTLKIFLFFKKKLSAPEKAVLGPCAACSCLKLETSLEVQEILLPTPLGNVRF
jgi:hypothetical protein